MSNQDLNTKQLIDRILCILSFKHKLIGCGYMREALKIFSDSYDVRVLLCKDVYPVIAAKQSKTSTSVERAIRNAISDCYYYGNLKFVNVLLNSNVVNDKYPPTNGELIAELSAFLYRVNNGEEDISEIMHKLKNPPKDND